MLVFYHLIYHLYVLYNRARNNRLVVQSNLTNHSIETVRIENYLSRDKKLHASRLGEEKLLASSLYLHDLILLR